MAKSIELKSAEKFLKDGRQFCARCYYKMDNQCPAGKNEYAQCLLAATKIVEAKKDHCK